MSAASQVCIKSGRGPCTAHQAPRGLTAALVVRQPISAPLYLLNRYNIMDCPAHQDTFAGLYTGRLAFPRSQECVHIGMSKHNLQALGCPFQTLMDKYNIHRTSTHSVLDEAPTVGHERMNAQMAPGPADSCRAAAPSPNVIPMLPATLMTHRAKLVL